MRSIELPEQMNGTDGFTPLRRDRGRHSAFQKTGENDIHTDPIASMRSGKILRQAKERRLGGGVSRLPDRWMKRRKAGNKNDMTGPSFHHSRQRSSRTIQGPLEIDGKNFIPRGFRESCQWHITSGAGCTNQKVHRLPGEITLHQRLITDVQISTGRSENFPIRGLESSDDRTAQRAACSRDNRLVHLRIVVENRQLPQVRGDGFGAKPKTPADRQKQL